MCRFPSPVNTLAEQQLASFAAFIPSENDYLTTSGPKPSKPDEPFGRGDLMHGGGVDESNIRFYFRAGWVRTVWHRMDLVVALTDVCLPELN